MNTDALKNLLLESLNKTYVEDSHLYENNLCERSKVFRIGLILSQKINGNLEYTGYSVDSEYNKRGSLDKIITRDNAQYPDLILHRRGNNPDENLLVVEFKILPTNRPIDDFKNDKDKLVHLTKDKEYNYKLGAHVCLYSSGYIIKWYQAGKPESEFYIFDNKGKEELKNSDSRILNNKFLKVYARTKISSGNNELL